VSELKKFRLINKIEGFSYLFLLFVAMPLKHMAGFPIATKIAGMIHGVLFIGFVYQLIMATEEVPFSKKEAFIFFVASLIPFGSFYIEAQCKEKK